MRSESSGIFGREARSASMEIRTVLSDVGVVGIEADKRGLFGTHNVLGIVRYFTTGRQSSASLEGVSSCEKDASCTAALSSAAEADTIEGDNPTIESTGGVCKAEAEVDCAVAPDGAAASS